MKNRSRALKCKPSVKHNSDDYNLYIYYNRQEACFAWQFIRQKENSTQGATSIFCKFTKNHYGVKQILRMGNKGKYFVHCMSVYDNSKTTGPIHIKVSLTGGEAWYSLAG